MNDSRSISFLVCEMGTVTPSSQGCREDLFNHQELLLFSHVRLSPGARGSQGLGEGAVGYGEQEPDVEPPAWASLETARV